MKPSLGAALFASLSLLAMPSSALVHYDQGRRLVKGIQLLQDADDPSDYYYVPQFPRLSTKADGSLEMLCLKYVDPAGATSGGLFHALVEFTLPPDFVSDVESELKKQVAGARLVGPVPLLQAVEEGEGGTGSFQVVSGVLADREKGGFTRSVVTSGRAPLLPGSKVAIAAILDQPGASLLWSSLAGPTSDVSVAIHAYYEAAIKGYNARITADVSTAYRHFSQVSNRQHSYTRRQIRKVVDELQRTGALKIEVVDRSAALGIKATEMEGVLQAVTSKLTELMFDHTGGWAADPARETAVENDQIQGRLQGGWLSRVFRGAKDTPYYTDDQYVLKDRKDIRHNVFSLVLSRTSTIRVPVDTAGNLGGLYNALGADHRYFRIVSLADPAFEFRPVHFQVDGEYVGAFQDTVNFVSVSLRKSYPGQATFTRSLRFGDAELKAGKTIQDIAVPRLGMNEADWLSYEYQVRWSLRDGPTVRVPPEEDRWVRTSDPAVSLLPPFEKRVIQIEADRPAFSAKGFSTAVVEFATVLAGRPKLTHKVTLRATDTGSPAPLALYHDRGTPIAVRVTWHSPASRVVGRLEVLESDSLYLIPPDEAGARAAAPAEAR
jgi:hypothetical protein